MSQEAGQEFEAKKGPFTDLVLAMSLLFEGLEKGLHKIPLTKGTETTGLGQGT
jgi:hypothetical protein